MAAQVSTMRRCFVCLSDEDDPEFVSQEWVNPCPCTLAAHQSCILDWVADVERQRRPLQCPICKAPIRLQQPFDLVTWLSDSMYNALSRVSPPALALIFSTTTLAGSASYGLGALIVFAGPHDALTALWTSNPGSWYERIRWATVFHLPLVGPSLILNKYVRLFGRYSTVPHFLLYTLVSRLSSMKPPGIWPPNPWLFMAWYPEVYRIYCKAYRELFGDFERRLDQELKGNSHNHHHQQQGGDVGRAVDENQALPQPDAAVPEQQEDPAPAAVAGPAAQPNPAPQQDHQGFVDVLLNLFRPEDDENGQDGARNNGDRRRHRRGLAGAAMPGLNLQIEVEEVINDGPAAQIEIIPDNNDNDNNNNNGAAGGAGGRRADNNIELPALIDIANSITHSLLFPGIACAVGEALKRTVLPKSWTTSRSPLPATGLLQGQWGRSIVGGCLYVVLRDVFRLYAKYRRVQIKPLRRVKDVDRSRNARNNSGSVVNS